MCKIMMSHSSFQKLSKPFITKRCGMILIFRNYSKSKSCAIKLLWSIVKLCDAIDNLITILINWYIFPPNLIHLSVPRWRL